MESKWYDKHINSGNAELVEDEFGGFLLFKSGAEYHFGYRQSETVWVDGWWEREWLEDCAA